MPASPSSPADLLADLDLPIERDAPLGPLTWYGVGGHAEVLARPRSTAQLASLVSRCREHSVPLYVLGAGANLLVRDAGVPGVVVKLDDPAWQQLSIDTDAATITVGAGYDLFKLVTQSAKAGLDGLVHIAGIPATVGGALRMNAGGAFGDIGSAVASVQVMAATGQTYTRDRDDLDFQYRKSNIHAPFILEATFQLTPEDPEPLMKRLKEIWFYKKTTQPMSEHTAGCCFKNPNSDDQPAADGRGAGQLIDEAGLKGHTVGSATVSDLHANFISAAPNGSADDVLTLLDHVATVVQDTHDVSLERELVVWP
ncbi:MAG: UDP-N-acetylmuramate dehydrogenase [Planctomycetota bacterium]